MDLKWWSRRSKRGAPAEPPLARAQALRLRDDFDGARGLCLEILRDAPRDAQALALMAAIAADQRQVAAGLQWAGQALAVDPECVPAHFAAGRLYEAGGRHADAEACFRRVTEIDPGHAQGHTNLGCALHLQGRIEEAVACYRRALELQPGQPVALRNYALVAGGAQEVGEAIRGFEELTAAHPADASAQEQLGHLYVQVGRREDALERYDRAIALEPERAESHFARAQVLLSLGRYPEGWREYEWRWRMELLKAVMYRFPQPRWDGGMLQGTLLLHGEPAFGDTLQLVRYAALAAQRCTRVLVECPPSLQALVAGVQGVAQAVPEGAPLPRFDAQLPLIACPGLFESTLENLGSHVPYIRPDPEVVGRWRPLVAGSEPRARKVGLVWTGNPGNLGNRRRSLTLQHFGGLVEARDVTFFSLQKGGPDVAPGPVPERMHFVDLTGRIRDFSDTAALVAQLDLVISVDTSVAHLAGAMGVPVWVLLPSSADWRYHVGRDDNPWYPSMRLFRQDAEGDWSGALQRLRLAFLEWAGG